MQNQLDPQVVNLAKAIRQSESGGDFNAKGKSGEIGAYQFTEPTWNSTAPKYGINVPLSQATPEQQNAVAYNKIKEWKDKGHDVTQIASMWNAGEAEPNAYTGKFGSDTLTHKAGEPSVGVNKFGAKYDVPTYAKRVSEAYLKLKSGQEVGIDPQNPSSIGTQYGQKPGIGEQLKDRGSKLAGDIGSIISGKDETGQQQNVVSGTIQAVGDIAGGVGDIVNWGLDKVTLGLLGKVEDLVGQGVGALAKTSAGKYIAESIQSFSQKHPELAGDIGAAFNIATALPIFKGLKVLGSAALDTGAMALKNAAEKGAIKDITSTLTRTNTGRAFLQRSPNVVKDLIDTRLINDLEIQGGKFITSEVKNASWNNIETLGKKVSQILEQPQYAKVTGGAGKAIAETVQAFPNSKFTYETVMENARKLTPQNDLLWDAFERGEASLAQINQLRSDLDQALKSTYQKLSRPPIEKQIALEFTGNLRNLVKESARETASLFDEMAKNFKIQESLKYIEGKPIKGGLVGNLIKDAGTVGGEMAGNTVGVPIAGALAGRGVAGLVERTLGRLAPRAIRAGILKRTAPEVIKKSGQEIVRRTSGLIGGAMGTRVTSKK